MPAALKNTEAFQPIQVGKLKLSHRLALAPLTRLRAPKNIINDHAPEYYSKRGSTPGTLLVTEATAIRPETVGYGLEPGIWNQEQIDAWKKVTSAVHEKNSYIFLQLWAQGRQASPKVANGLGFEVPSASGIPLNEGDPKPHALTTKEVKEYSVWFADAAKNAIKAGFDGVEIHGANGYLLDEFLHENTNKRTDEYGGSIENRARFSVEVLDAVIDAVGAERVGYRISPWGTFGNVDPGDDPVPQWAYLLSEFQKRADAGKEIAYVNTMEPRVNFVSADSAAADHHLNDFIHEYWKGNTIRNGGFGHSVADIKTFIAFPKVLIGIGRKSISNPDFVEKYRDGKDLDPYNRPTFYWDGGNAYPLEVGYTKYLTPEESHAHGYP